MFEKRRGHGWLSLAILLTGWVLWGEALFAAPLSLKAVIEYGVENAPALKSARNKLESAELARKNVFSSFLPSLDVSLINGHQSPSSVQGNPWAGQLAFTLTEQLYDNGTSLIRYDLAKMALRQATVEYARDRAALCLDVIREYNNYSQFAELVKVQQFQYEILSVQYKSIEGKFHRGEKSRTEYLRFKARLQRSSLSLRTAQNSLAKATEDLKALIGWRQGELELQSGSPDEAQVSHDTEKPPVFENHYESQIAEQQIAINNMGVRFVERRYFPEVSLSAGSVFQNNDLWARGDAMANNAQTHWNALLTVKYNIWDWGIRRRDIAIAKLDRDTGNNTVDSRLLDLRATINKLMLDLRQLKDNYRLNKELVELERQNFSSLERDYRSGRATFLDLVNSVDNLTTARELYLRTYYQLNGLIAEYKYHQGRLYESVAVQ